MIRNEISKIVKSPYMWGVLLFCILINCGILCFENTEDFSSSQYKKVWQQFLSEEKNLQDEIASSKDKAADMALPSFVKNPISVSANPKTATLITRQKINTLTSASRNPFRMRAYFFAP